jgi:hypothetical protein
MYLQYLRWHCICYNYGGHYCNGQRSDVPFSSPPPFTPPARLMSFSSGKSQSSEKFAHPHLYSFPIHCDLSIVPTERKLFPVTPT